jgi:hypothetical protein
VLRHGFNHTPTIRTGVLNDQSDPHRDDDGPIGEVCAKQALEDFGISTKGWESARPRWHPPRRGRPRRQHDPPREKQGLSQAPDRRT